jgi:hypothetical protein
VVERVTAPSAPPVTFSWLFKDVRPRSPKPKEALENQCIGAQGHAPISTIVRG